jgi:hypothetical protein
MNQKLHFEPKFGVAAHLLKEPYTMCATIRAKVQLWAHADTSRLYLNSILCGRVPKKRGSAPKRVSAKSPPRSMRRILSSTNVSDDWT